LLHLHLIPESPPGGPHWACAEIRLLRPYRHPSLQTRIRTTVGRSLPSERVDAVVVQRGGPGVCDLDYVVELVRQIRRRGLPMIHDIDDDLLAEHPSDRVEKAIAPNRPRVRFLMGEADLVIASTEALAARVARINPNVRVWRNALDERLVDADLGYVGTVSHLEDLLGVVESLQEGLSGLADRPSVEICGVDDKARSAQLFSGQAEVSVVPTSEGYSRFMSRFQQRKPWKAGIAPLSDNLFNAGKSDIKFLDYALFGIAAVYPRGEVYGEVVHGETGLVAGPGEWGTMVRRLIEEPDLRRRIRAGAFDHLMQQRVLARRAPALFDILDETL
jgi:hypothetical protein